MATYATLPITTDDSGGPYYLQIATQIQQLVDSGHLKSGDELPTIVQLSLQLLISPNITAKAYQELQQRGAIDQDRTVI